MWNKTIYKTDWQIFFLELLGLHLVGEFAPTNMFLMFLFIVLSVITAFGLICNLLLKEQYGNKQDFAE